MWQDVYNRPRWSEALAFAALAWVIALLLAPLAALLIPPRSLWSAISASVYAAGAVVCHQRPERSFAIGAVPLPVCARCTGLYVGAALAACAAVWHARGRRMPLSVGQSRVVLALASLPTALTLTFEWSVGQAPSNGLRAATGFPLGAAVAWVIVSLDSSRPSVEVN